MGAFNQTFWNAFCHIFSVQIDEDFDEFWLGWISQTESSKGGWLCERSMVISWGPIVV